MTSVTHTHTHTHTHTQQKQRDSTHTQTHIQVGTAEYEPRTINKKFFELWNEEYRDGIKTGGDTIGTIQKVLSILPPKWLHQGVAA